MSLYRHLYRNGLVDIQVAAHPDSQSLSISRTGALCSVSISGMSPDAARQVAAYLLELADLCEPSEPVSDDVVDSAFGSHMTGEVAK